jgi:quercetin dioxygenase-like cupin family protein
MSRVERAKLENVRVDKLTGGSQTKLAFEPRSVEDLRTLRAKWLERDSIPLLIPGRGAAEDNSWPGMDVRTFLTGDHSSGRLSAHEIVIPPGGGLPPHCQHDADMYFYVIEGEVEFTVGKLTERSRADSYAFIPSQTTGAFLNKSNAPARLFAICYPAGAERAFAAAHELWVKTGDVAPGPYLAALARFGFCFDLAGPLPNDARTNTPDSELVAKVESFDDFMAMRRKWTERRPVPILRHDTKGCYQLRVPDGPTWVTSKVLVSGDDSRGGAVMFYGEVDAGYSAPPHFQPSEEELFYLIEGELRLTCGNATMQLDKGYFGFAPRGATHGFVNNGNAVTRIITLNSPAGHERGFRMIEEFLKAPTDGFEERLSNHGWQMHSMDAMGPEGTHAASLQEDVLDQR